MKKRISIFLILIVLILVALIWIWWPNAAQQSQQAAKSPITKANTASSNTTQISPILGPITTNAQGQPEARINPALPAATQMQMILDAQNGRQIDFYGKVIDQYGEPIAEVKVRGVIVLSSMAGTANQDNFAETDGNGIFKFNNLHGPNFGVALSKDGYAPYIGPNWSESYKPDPNNPEVFIMWKLQGSESLVHQRFIVMLPCDGTSKNVDLHTGKTVSKGGDITITFTRNPVQITIGKPFEWTLTVDVPGGGLQEIHDLYPYEAPEDGYQQTITVATGPDPKTYVNSSYKSYYYKSADSKYGRVSFGLHADYQPPPTLLGIEVYLNPSGSRNLEPPQPPASPAAQ